MAEVPIPSQPQPATLTAHRRLVAAEEYLLLLPTTLLTVVVTAFACLLALRFTPASALVAVNGLLAMAALVATWKGVNAFRKQGEAGLKVLEPRVVLAMSIGLVLVAIGGLALLVEYATGNVDTGALAFNVLGLPAVVPCLHLLSLRAQAPRDLRAEAASTKRARQILVALFVAIPALQWMATGPRPFDREDWLAQAEASSDPWFRRPRMADWMVLDGSLVGLSRAEVIARLGEPDYVFVEGRSLVYSLGQGRAIDGFSDEGLWLSLDSSQHVIEARVEVEDD